VREWRDPVTDGSVASDGIEALRILEEKDVDVVISDIMMPGMDGIELAKRIKEEHDADVILITGFIDEYSYDKVIESVSAISWKNRLGLKS